MGKELTPVDVKKIKEEIHQKEVVERPKVMEEVKRTRAYGDLSENAEYKEAKRLQRKLDGRVRYLKKLLKEATIVEVTHNSDTVGLFSTVRVKFVADGKVDKFQIVSPLRIDVMKHLISKDSPVGKALWNHSVGDVVTVNISEQVHYQLEILNIEPGEDREDLPILSY